MTHLAVTLLNLTPAWLVLGGVALAAGLYLLQRLRVRHRVITVMTTVFWREAVEETRARVLVKRFRHLPAYLLALLIALLLWLAVAEPALSGGARERSYVLLLDGSAAMSADTRFDEATAALEEALAGLPRDRTEVVLCAGRVHPLLRPGEESLLLRHRLAGFRPEAAPASVEATLRDLAAAHGDDAGLTALVFGAAPLRRTALDALVGVEVRRAWSPGDQLDNRGIVALGAAHASSGRWDVVDVVVEVDGGDTDADALDVQVDGAPLAADRRVVERGGGRTVVLLTDVPASGGVLEVALPDAADDLGLDDVARLTLPDRPLIRVAVPPAAPAALVAALEADAAVIVTTSGPADVVVATDGAVPDGVPALVLVPESAQDDAFVVVSNADALPALPLLIADLGIDQIDAMALADVAQRPITLRSDAGAIRAVRVWAELFGPAYDFGGSRAFPLFVARAVRWLSGAAPLVPYAAAGAPLPSVRDSFGRTATAGAAVRVSSFGAPFVPARAEALSADGGAGAWVSLLDPALTAAPDPDDVAGADGIAATRGPDLLVLILIAVLLLLALEWWLHGTGRIP